MAFAALERLRSSVARLDSPDTAQSRYADVHLGRRGYTITCVKGLLPEGLMSMELASEGEGKLIQSLVWDPSRVRAAKPEWFHTGQRDSNGKKAQAQAQDRANKFEAYAKDYHRPRNYHLVIKRYPGQAVLLKIFREPTPMPAVDVSTGGTS
jgi:hypothetical protein